MERQLWQPPVGPPPRPDGVPDRPGSWDWLEWISEREGQPTRVVWAWIRGEWVRGFVSSEGRNRFGWWFFVWITGGPHWVHEAATAAWGPGPEDEAWLKRIREAHEEMLPEKQQGEG